MKAADLQASASRAASLLKALSNPLRLQILCHLADGEQSVGGLQRRVGLSQSALSQHLAVLRRKGIVATRREAQSIYYSLNSKETVAIMNTLYAVFCARNAANPQKTARRRQGIIRAAVPRASTA